MASSDLDGRNGSRLDAPASLGRYLVTVSPTLLGRKPARSGRIMSVPRSAAIALAVLRRSNRAPRPSSRSASVRRRRGGRRDPQATNRGRRVPGRSGLRRRPRRTQASCATSATALKHDGLRDGRAPKAPLEQLQHIDRRHRASSTRRFHSSELGRVLRVEFRANRLRARCSRTRGATRETRSARAASPGVSPSQATSRSSSLSRSGTRASVSSASQAAAWRRGRAVTRAAKHSAAGRRELGARRRITTASHREARRRGAARRP